MVQLSHKAVTGVVLSSKVGGKCSNDPKFGIGR